MTDTDDQVREAVAEQVVQSSETIENLRIKVVELKLAAKKLGFHNAPEWLAAIR